MDYPEPLVIPPRSLPHKQTFVLLHGRGSSGEKFGPALLDAPIPLPSPLFEPSPRATTLTLAFAFPHARFVFPTAARRRAAVYRRAYTRQWFDNWKLDPPATDREELQVPGLCETTAYLHDLLRSEIAAVPGGAANVVLGGLSQGCAAALVALLLWEGEALGAGVGMCGWLPFAVRLNEQLFTAPDGTVGNRQQEMEGSSARDCDVVFDPFERQDTGGEFEDQGSESDPSNQAIDWLREELQIPKTCSTSTALAFRDIPLFLAHGVEDDRVSVILGQHASGCLGNLGAKVRVREYESLGHWYSGDMLRDMVQFIRTKMRWD